MKVQLRRSKLLFHTRNDSLHSQPQAPLLEEEAVEDDNRDPKAGDGGPRRKDDNEEQKVAHGHDTMLDLISQKVGREDSAAQHCANNKQKAELLHFGIE